MTNQSEPKYLAWHFAKADEDGHPILGYGDNRRIEVGKTLSVNGEPELCQYGLHGSIKILNALAYAKGGIITRVEIFGRVKKGDDKIVGQHRTCVQYMREQDSDELLRYFARQCALSVADKWGCPDIVLEYLMTGDEKCRSAADSAAYSAARSAAYSVAYSAADSAADSAAYSAADSAARLVAYSAADSVADSAAYRVARSVAYSAICSAADSVVRREVNDLLEDLVLQEMRLV